LTREQSESERVKRQLPFILHLKVSKDAAFARVILNCFISIIHLKEQTSDGSVPCPGSLINKALDTGFVLTSPSEFFHFQHAPFQKEDDEK
jgi:hypothetical protein